MSGGARVAALCLGAGVLASAISLKQAYGEMREQSVEMGRVLAGFADVIGDSTQLVVNGNKVYAGGHYTPLELEAVMDGVAQRCKQGAWNLDDDLKHLDAATQKLAAQETFGAVREQTDSEGAIICLAAPPQKRGLAEIASALEYMVDTGDTSRLGDARYVYARRNPRGGTNTVHVWTEGKMNLWDMFPEDGDAPGDDMLGVPRPPGSTRTLSAAFASGQYAFRSYKTKQTPDQLVDHYDRMLAKLSWDTVPVAAIPGAPADFAESTRHIRAFLKNGASFILLATEHEKQTYAHFIQIGSRGVATATAHAK